MKLNELSPSEVFSYFEKICSIPHGSGNTGMIADYCLEFAKDSLCTLDELNDVEMRNNLYLRINVLLGRKVNRKEDGI